eukprot:6192010-Pleurochrysis_carterae.AAC.3
MFTAAVAADAVLSRPFFFKPSDDFSLRFRLAKNARPGLPESAALSSRASSTARASLIAVSVGARRPVAEGLMLRAYEYLPREMVACSFFERSDSR